MIIVVVPAPVIITQIIIIDLDSGEQIIRVPGSNGDQDTPQTTGTIPEGPGLTIPPDVVVGTGDVQVTLLWANDSDMDLHVIDPDGTEIYFSNRTSPSGGQLDVDDIPSSGDNSTHVENIFWAAEGAPTGTYSVFVNHYSSHSGGANSYTLEVRVGGELIHQESGTLAVRRGLAGLRVHGGRRGVGRSSRPRRERRRVCPPAPSRAVRVAGRAGGGALGAGRGQGSSLQVSTQASPWSSVRSAAEGGVESLAGLLPLHAIVTGAGVGIAAEGP